MSSSNVERAVRLTAEVSVGYSGGRIEGIGKIANVSASGALIANATTRVPNGSELRLEFWALSGLEAFSVRSEVIRQTDDGFAVRFLADADHSLLILFLQLLEDAQAELDANPPGRVRGNRPT